jgi:CheY-like chemotaxis protein
MQDNENVTLTIAISDTGIGIPVEQQKVIFEKFTRLEAAYKGQYDGMGLGLYDVKELCLNLGGDITVIRNDKGGSTFTCELTFKLANEQNLLTENTETKKQKSSIQKNLRVLLVEDQPIAAHVAKTILCSKGHNVDTVENGYAALEKFSQHPYDLVLLDIGLTDIEGFSLAKKLKSIENKNNLLPTLLFALTAHEEEQGDFSCMDYFLQKPFSIDALQTALTNIQP